MELKAPWTENKVEGGGNYQSLLRLLFELWMIFFRSATSRAELGVLIFLVVGFALSTMFVVFKYYHLRKMDFFIYKDFSEKNLVLNLLEFHTFLIFHSFSSFCTFMQSGISIKMKKYLWNRRTIGDYSVAANRYHLST